LGKFDGIELLPGGRMLVTSWADSSVHLFSGQSDVKLVRDLWQPADLGLDTRRNRVAVPVGVRERVELWSLPSVEAK